MRHPNVVHFLGMFYERNDPLPMLVMEFLSTNLNECIDQYGILTIEISCSILHEVSLGLNYLHNQNPPILHRDLSTKAILLASNMMAKIAGLGMAKAYDPHTLQMMRIPGNVSFMPPETFVNHPKYDMTIDVFSFGVVMIHVFSGNMPVPTEAVCTFPDGTMIAVSEAVRRTEYLRAIDHDHPLMDLILKCISNHPPQRGNASEIVQRLKDAVVRFPPSFANKVEMLRRIKTLEEDLEAGSVQKGGSQIGEEQRALEQRVKQSEAEAQAANQRRQEAERCAEMAETALQEAENTVCTLLQSVDDAQKKAEKRINTRMQEAERRATDAETRLDDVTRQLQAASHRAMDAERRTTQAERHATDVEAGLDDVTRQLQVANQRALDAEHRSAQVNVDDELAPFRLHIRDPLPSSREVGSGCYGTVYAVEVDRVQCIAKRVQDILLPEEQEDVGGHQRRAMKLKFRQECILLSKIRHPNIVQFIGVRYGRDMYDLTLVMERLPMDLQKCLERCHTDRFFIPLSIRFSILLDVTYGLLHLHNRSILHRDLTAGNILLTSSMRAKIADLGVSRIVEARHSQKLSTLPGTIGYMPPEALKDNAEYHLKLDIFSFGVLTLFVALQTFPAFSWERVPDEVAAKEEAELYKRRKWISKIGEQHYLYPLIHQCLQDDSAARPSTIDLNAMMKELGTKFPLRLQDIDRLFTQLKKLGMSDIIIP